MAGRGHNDPKPFNLEAWPLNIIRHIAEMDGTATGFMGAIIGETTMTNDALRRQLAVTQATKRFRSEAAVSFADCMTRTVEWFRAHRT